jgi:tetratricopeptide (TPR) repeat protein
MQRSIALVAVLALGIPLFANPQPAIPQPAHSQPLTSAAETAAPTVTITPELRGDLAMARRQYMAAIAAYREAPADSPQVWDKMGMAWHHLFAMEEARRDYQHALHLRPNYPEALNNVGAVYYAKKEYGRAIKYYRKALRLQPSAAVLSNLGTAYFALGKAALGLDAYRNAFALDPKVFDNNAVPMVIEPLPTRDRAQQDFCLAQVFAASGRESQAIDYLRRALNEGFADRRKLLEDETLATIRATPAFTELLAEQKLQ